jgi:hypothetical protein
MRTIVAAFIVFLMGGSLLAQGEPSQPTDAPTFLGLYGWKQAIWQYTADAEGEYTVEKGDVWGGRLVGGLGFGRIGFEMRVDVSGLKEQFAFDDPETFNTLEVYGAVHYVWLSQHGLQIGPAAVVGSISDEQSVGGIGLDLYGGGVRIGGFGAEFHIAIGVHDYLPQGGWRFSLSGHIPVFDRLYAVGDIVSGQDGYARVGVAVRIK